MKKSITLAAALIMILIALPAQAGTVFDQGFEIDTSGWFTAGGYGTIDRVLSGTGGIDAKSGSYYAVVNNGNGAGDSAPFTRFDGYRSTWPVGGFSASADIYLDPNWAVGSGFDYSVAANGADGAHRRDFIFHVGEVAAGTLLIGADNNTNFATRMDLASINNYAVTSAGWYTFQQKFYDKGGSLAVDLNLYDALGNLLFTETRQDLSDLIPSVVGGNRYGWFTFVDVGTNGLAIDNTQLDVVPLPGAVWLLGSGLAGLAFYRRRWGLSLS